jgi:biopolymer transport protein ExbD
MKLVSHLPKYAPWIFVVPLFNIIGLVFFFLIYSPSYIDKQGVKVELPKGEGALTFFEQAHILTIVPSEPLQYYLNGEILEVEKMNEKFKQAYLAYPKLIILSDQQVRYGKVMEMMDEAIKIGFEVAVATQSTVLVNP